MELEDYRSKVYEPYSPVPAAPSWDGDRQNGFYYIPSCLIHLYSEKVHIINGESALLQVDHDPLAMYKGDLMTVNVNLAGILSVTACPVLHRCFPGASSLISDTYSILLMSGQELRKYPTRTKGGACLGGFEYSASALLPYGVTHNIFKPKSTQHF